MWRLPPDLCWQYLWHSLRRNSSCCERLLAASTPAQLNLWERLGIGETQFTTAHFAKQSKAQQHAFIVSTSDPSHYHHHCSICLLTLVCSHTG